MTRKIKSTICILTALMLLLVSASTVMAKPSNEIKFGKNGYRSDLPVIPKKQLPEPEMNLEDPSMAEEQSIESYSSDWGVDPPTGTNNIDFDDDKWFHLIAS